MGSGQSVISAEQQRMQLEKERRLEEREDRIRQERNKQELDILALKSIDQDNIRKSELLNKKADLNHAHQMDNQARMFEVLGTKASSMTEIAYGACILNAIQTDAVDKDILLHVMSKIPTPLNVPFEQIVDRVIEQAREIDDESVNEHVCNNVEEYT
ncbi:unnamed protein product [Orchesella dallaii]|uniref:Uncharacterized protein n=1 Tax=Orchesella dallaii TaxID=48710 RepID=A0ABP1QC34_9HEXA